MMRLKRITFSVIVFILAAFPCGRVLAQAPESKASSVSFAGKRLIIVIPYSPGGAADIMARVMLPFLPEQIPGEPRIIIRNMPGGGGLVGTNWVYNIAPRDGTVIGQFSVVLTDAIFRPEGMKYDSAGFTWLGGVAETAVGFVHANLGIRSAEELAAARKKIFLGTLALSSPRGMFQRLFLELLGVDYKMVPGYGSSADMRTAMERGELDIAQDSLSGYSKSVTPMIQEGLVVPIAQEGTIQRGKIVRDERLPDIPTYSELLVQLKGKGVTKKVEYRAMELLLAARAIQRGWVYVESVPGDVLDLMAEAFERLLNDPDMHRVYNKIVGFKPVTLNASEAQEIADSVVVMIRKEPEAVKLLQELARKL